MSDFKMQDPAKMVEQYIFEIKEFIASDRIKCSVCVNEYIVSQENPMHCRERVLRFAADRSEGGLRITDLYLSSEFSGVLSAVMQIVENGDKFDFVAFDGSLLIERIPFEEMGYVAIGWGVCLEVCEVWKVLVVG